LFHRQRCLGLPGFVRSSPRFCVEFGGPIFGGLTVSFGAPFEIENGQFKSK
jgi:hypothetical protein